MMNGKKRHARTETSPPVPQRSSQSITAAGLNLGICDDQPEAGHMNYDIIFNYNVL